MTEASEINKIPMHFVSTIEEAKKLTETFDKFWVLDCGCRLQYSKGDCKRSRIDVCLLFEDVDAPWGSNKKEISKKEMESILKEAKDKHLVSRPFRDYETRSRTQGICFCCDCCCAYFRNGGEGCPKGKLIEFTDMDTCTHCGECVEVCYFKARSMNKDEHEVDREKCYGCGLCVEVCPVECIEMVER